MFDLIGKTLHGIKQAFYGLHQVRRGLSTVAMHAWREPTTQVYPDKVPDTPAHFRGRLALTVNPETGEHLCISCRQCERVCPDKCIEITAHKSPETNKLELIDFKIDHGLCMFCGLCTEVCPTYCIINTNDFEMADYTRESLIYDLKKLTLTQEESAYYFDRKEMPLPKPKPAKPAPGAAPAKPSPATAAPAAGTATPPAPAAAPATPAASPPPAKEAATESAGGKLADAKSEEKTETKAPETPGEKTAEKPADQPGTDAKPPATPPNKEEKEEKKD
jgi:NADH-quinone oxidoreductase subunit I